MITIKAGMRVRTQYVSKFLTRNGGVEVIPAGTLGTIMPVPPQGMLPQGNYLVALDGYKDEHVFDIYDLEIIAPDTPTLEQQLADALARAERAERERDALKAFVEDVAKRGPQDEPVRSEYKSEAAFNEDNDAWELGEIARAALAAAEKAVGDVPHAEG